MAGRKGCRRAFSGLRPALVSLAALGFSVSAASSQNQAPRATKAFHATKDCSGFTGLAGAFCTIRSSNVKALKVGSKIFYFQPAGKTALDSDIGHLRGAWHRRDRPLPPSFRDRGRTVHDLGRHGNARRVPCPCPCHGRFVDPEAVALGRDVQLRSGLDPVGNRPVSERVARWLSSLSAKYIAVFALLVAVPVICTSVYLLNSSYQDNKRALTRLQQEKAKSVAVTIDQYFKDLTERMKAMQGQYLSSTALGAALQPLLDDNATDCVLRRQRRAQDARKRGRRAHPVKGNFSHRSIGGAGEGDGSLLRSQCTRRGSCPTPEHDRWRSSFAESRSRGLPANRRNRSRRRDARSRRHSGSRQADASRDVRIRLRGRRQRRADRAPERRRFHTSFPGSSSGDEGAGFVEHGIDGRPQLPRAKGVEHLGDRRAGRLEGVRRAARERGVRAGPRKDLADGAAARGVPRRRGRPERVARPPSRPPDQADADGSGPHRRGRLRRADRAPPPRRAGWPRRRAERDGGEPAGIGQRPGAKGRGTHAGVAAGARRALAEGPPARGRERAQERVPGQHVARAADAAERDHRLLAGAAAAAVRRDQREAGGVPRRHPLVRQPPARR